MIELAISLGGVPSEKRIILGNQWENNDEYIQLNLPKEFDSYNKYMIAVYKKTTSNGIETITRVLPINNNQFIISSQLTCLSGNWTMYVMCRENKIDLEQETISLLANNNEHVFISSGFIGVVNGNLIEKDNVDNMPLDSNLKIIYEELLSLKNDFSDNNQNDNPTEVEMPIKEGYYYETLMKDATFVYTTTNADEVHGVIYGNSLFTINKVHSATGNEFLLIFDNGVNIYEYMSDGLNPNGFISGSNVGIDIDYNDNTLYSCKMPLSVYQERNTDVKVTIKYKVQDEKILVKQDGTPLNKPLILDSTVDYTNLPFKGDEAYQALQDGRQILVKVPNRGTEAVNIYENYMPVFQHQVPINNNNYLSLLYMKDRIDNNLSAVLRAAMQGNSPDFSMVYGEITMKLSKPYIESLLK